MGYFLILEILQAFSSFLGLNQATPNFLPNGVHDEPIFNDAN
jgi:hypothetical protein